MFSEFNTIIRTKVQSLTLLYKGNAIPIYYEEDINNDKGAHALVLTVINEPISNEVGFAGAETLTGFVQFQIQVPTKDNGINFALSDLSSQLYSQFPRSNFVDGDFKVEWLNVQKEPNVREGGHYSVTCRVNFRTFSC
jgi:hypothetical protein